MTPPVSPFCVATLGALSLLVACTAPDDRKDDPAGDDSAGDDSAATDDSGDPGQPTLRWLRLAGTCGADLVFEDVPAGAMAVLFTYRTEAGWWLNPGLGMSGYLDETNGTLTVPCGSGNDLSPGTEARVALGYPASALPGGEVLGFEVYSGVCGAEPLVLAEDVDMELAGLSLSYQTEAGWALNPALGMSSVLDDGALTVACGAFDNSIRPDSAVNVALGYAEGGEDLDWLTVEGVCEEAALRFTARPDPVAVSFQTEWWAAEGGFSVNTGLGMSSVLDAAGEVEIPCGGGNSIPEGSAVRVALGYAP